MHGDIHLSGPEPKARPNPMTHVLVLIAPAKGPKSAHLSQPRIEELLTQIPLGNRGTPNWLSENEACEIPIHLWDGNGAASAWANETEMLAFLRKHVLAPASETLDVALVPSHNRRKKLLISDMDSTMIEQECIDEIADIAGIKDKVSAITQRAMNGELDFAEALIERVNLLQGLTTDALRQVLDERITLMQGARSLVQTMNKNGAECVLVSGGFTFFTSAIAHRIGFHTDHANTLEISDDTLTGRVVPPILGAQAKLETLQSCLERKGLMPDDALAVGDGANDLAMIQNAGLGVAYHPHAVLAKHADVVIRHGDLSTLLYVQGYPRDTFVTK